jgi:hypothetical protein
LEETSRTSLSSVHHGDRARHGVTSGLEGRLDALTRISGTAMLNGSAYDEGICSGN